MIPDSALHDTLEASPQPAFADTAAASTRYNIFAKGSLTRVGVFAYNPGNPRRYAPTLQFAEQYHNVTEGPSTMKRSLVGALIAVSPWLANAVDINVNLGNVRVEAPGVTVTFGDRDTRGYYWDGYEYRDPKYWREHNGPRGEKYYTGHGNNGVPHQGGGHCPPGQAKKGNC